MPATTHSEYRIEIVCPDLSSELRLERGVARERLGTLFEITLSLYSTDKEIDLAALLGKPMAVHVKTAKEERWFHGIVSHFALSGISDDHGHYQVVLRPKLWLLGESLSSRVFNGKTVADLLKDTFQRGGVDFGSVTSSPNVKFDYCVQYRESDLHFASRMMERWGLYYFHQHEQGKHSLEVVSSLAGHSDVGTFQHAWDGAENTEYQITNWRIAAALRSSNYKVEGTGNLTRAAISASTKTRFSVAGASQLKIHDFEAVDEYPTAWLDELAKARMQAIDATVEEFSGTCRSPKIAVGSLFTLDGHPRKEQNRQYLIVAAVYQFDGQMPGEASVADPYVVSFSAIDAKTTFSPPVVTRKPVVQGPHLATVVKETDEYGRVGVEFHWGNEDGPLESCPARVSQNWAGKEWGGVFLPHIGHEVIVEFLDGDPDQPLVTGRVYNQESMPPLSLPGEKQSSIIRDHGGNELRMDGGDPQKIRIFSPKENSEIVLGGGTHSHSYKGDGDLFVHFKGKQTEIIDKTKLVMVKKDVTRQTDGLHDETVMKDYTLTVGGNYKLNVKKDWHENIFGCTSKHIHGWKNEAIMGSETKTILGLKKEHVTGAKLTTGISYDLSKFLKKKEKVKEVFQIEAGTDVQIEAKKAISLKTEDLTQNVKNVLIDCTEKADITYKEAKIDGKTHSHQPSDKFEILTDEFFVMASKMMFVGDVFDIGGVFEVKK